MMMKKFSITNATPILNPVNIDVCFVNYCKTLGKLEIPGKHQTQY